MFKPGPVLINGDQINDKSSFNLVSIFSPSFQYGLNIFEGVRYYSDNKEKIPFLLDQHIKRLLVSSKLIGYEKFPSYSEVEKDINKLLNIKEIQDDIYIKYILGYIGEGSWYSTHEPDRICFYYSCKSLFRFEKPTYKKAKFTSIKRISHNNLSPKIKCGANYINSRFGYLEINSRKNDEEKYLPIFFDENGFISESSGSTIFIIQDKNIITPSLDNSILPSITREFLMKLFLEELKEYKIIEKNIDRWDLYKADSLFAVGTNIEILFISELDYISYNQELKINEKIFSIFKNKVIDN